MSRTDKDAPNWVRALHDPRRVILHNYTCELSDRGWGWVRADLRHPCTIDDPNNDHGHRYCRWWLEDRFRFRYTDGPGAKRLHDLYYGPERAAVRDSLRNALREANSVDDYDDIIAEPPTRLSRNSTWHGGYWD